MSERQLLLHIVFLRSGRLLLTKKQYASWRDIQDEYDDYMTSLGPWDVDSVLDFLRTEYPTKPPFTDEQVRKFIESLEMVASSAD